MGPALIGHLAIPTPQPLATLLLRRPNLHKAVQWATEVENDRRYGLVATAGGDGQIVGHAGWEREPDRPERAEVALEVADAMQGRGLGTALLCQLAEAANQMGIQVFDAEVLPENHRMLRVIRDCGFPVKIHSLPGVLLVELRTCLAAKAPKGPEPWDQASPPPALLQRPRCAPDVAGVGQPEGRMVMRATCGSWSLARVANSALTCTTS